MHSFPDMRRNSTYQNALNTGLYLAFLIIYNFFSSMYLFLPPLFAVLFLYFIGLVKNLRYYTMFCFIIIICSFEVSKGFYPGVLIVVYSLVYIFLFPKITTIFSNYNLFEFFYAPIIYILYFLLNSLIILFYNANVDIWSMMIVWYIVCESIIIVVIRWILGIK